MVNLKQLRRQRGAIDYKLNNFKDFLSKLQGETKNSKTYNNLYAELNDRMLSCESLLLEFEEVQTKIEALVTDDIVADEYKQRDSFSNIYFELLAKARLLKADEELSPNCNMSIHGSQHSISGKFNTQNVKLPTIKLPKFNGCFETWLEFKDTFQSLIHNNETIADIQKFHYLRASLENTAAETIQSIDFSENNYVLAWEVLTKRFDNHRLLVHNHVKAIFDLPLMQRESFTCIRSIIDSINTHLRSLKALKQPTESWDTLIIFIICQKLDKNTAREWEECKIKEKLPSLNDLIEFLIAKAELLETLESRYEDKSKIPLKNHKFQRNASLIAKEANCYFCKNNHFIFMCEEFKKLSISDRITKVRELKLCTNCLNIGHTNSRCLKGNCKKCDKKHNTLLHLETETEQSAVTNDPVKSICQTCTSGQRKPEILLATAYVNVKSSNGKFIKCKALLDSGSQSCFVSSNLSKRLQVNLKSFNIEIIGFNGVISTLNKQCELEIFSCASNYSKSISCYIVPVITDSLPVNSLKYNNWNIPMGIKLADPDFNKPSDIDLLLGANIFWELILNKTLSLGNNLPIMRETKLGWIISGSFNNTVVTKSHCNLVKVDIQEQLQSFWEIESVPSEKITSQEENYCEIHFKNTTSRNADGRFIVKMPLKESHTVLGNSTENAKKRFYSLENKFNRNPHFKERYVQFINEYLKLGHMTKLNHDLTNNSLNNVEYFLPHHGVIKEESLTTKLRVVFDGSCRTDSGYSLNDIQSVGPTIQQDSLSILLRFRQHRYVVSADVTKMYRQVLISNEQRSLQQIYWRDDPNHELETYQLATVTYGTASAPYLAIRCLYQLALESQDKYPESAQIIKRDFYVDDLLTGADDKQTAMRLCNEISNILKSGCFELRKWISNDHDILKGFENSSDCNNVVLHASTDKTKTLGLNWYCNNDTLTYNINNSDDKSDLITKRTMLSNIAQIYDPLGLLGPCIILAKIMLQSLWLLKLTWDDEVPGELKTKWLRFKQELTTINSLSIPRHAICANPIDTGFAMHQ